MEDNFLGYHEDWRREHKNGYINTSNNTYSTTVLRKTNGANG